MERNETLHRIRNGLFYGSTEYTKNQPDLFIPHRFRLLAPSQVDGFVDQVRGSIQDEDEILVYVHLPFCFTECLFCNSFPHKADREQQQAYLGNVLKEIELFSARGVFKGKKARCIYFGGGTPTSFSNRDLGMILDKISAGIALAEGCSINTEAHPLTLAGTKRVRELRGIGINRLSIGCQTFDQRVLDLCNRKNNEDQITRIVREVQDAGMSINIDMMAGLPGQTVAGVMKDLEALERIRPNAVEYIRHEIVNPLVIKLYRDDPGLIMSTDTLFDIICITKEWMSRNGYEENGRFTGDTQWGYRYHWLKEMPIIAFGARARSYTKTICYDKYEELSAYSNFLGKGALPIGRYIAFTVREQMYRSLLLNLQFKRGLDVNAFRGRFGSDPLEVFSSLCETLCGYGCLTKEDGNIRLTKYGAYFVEDVCDYIIDSALKEEPGRLVRAPHSEGGTSARLQ